MHSLNTTHNPGRHPPCVSALFASLYCDQPPKASHEILRLSALLWSDQGFVDPRATPGIPTSRTRRPAAEMALHYCIPDDRDAESISTERAVSHKSPTHAGSLSRHPGAWLNALASPTTSLPWVYSPAQPSSLDDFDGFPFPGAGTSHHHPYLSTITPLSICLGQPIPSVHAARHSGLWPVVDLTDCRSHASRCSSTSSADQDATSSVVGLPNSISGQTIKQERNVQSTSVNTALGTEERVLDTFTCRHCEKTFSTRSTLRSVSPYLSTRRLSGLLMSAPDTMKSSTIPSELTSTTAQRAREDFVILKISRDTLAHIVKRTSAVNMLARCVTRRSGAATISGVTRSRTHTHTHRSLPVPSTAPMLPKDYGMQRRAMLKLERSLLTTVTNNTNLEAALGQMLCPSCPQQTLTLLCPSAPDRRNLPPRETENLLQMMRKTPMENAHAAKSHVRPCPYFVPSSIALRNAREVFRYCCALSNGSFGVRSPLADPS